MDPVAELWVRSGRNHQLLYQGKTEDIITELKAFVQRRKVYNNLFLACSYEALRAIDSLQPFADRPGGFQQGQAPGMTDQVAAIAASQMHNINRTKVSYLLMVWCTAINVYPRVFRNKRIGRIS